MKIHKIPNNELTTRQIMVLDLMRQGNRVIELASLLNYSPATIKRECANILRKLNCRTFQQAMSVAYEKGIFKIKERV